MPLEAGAGEAAVFNSGMAAIMTAFFTFARPNSSIVYTAPLYGGTTGLIHQFPGALRRDAASRCRPGRRRRSTKPSARPRIRCIVFLETPANPTLIMTDIERAAETARRHPKRPVVMVDNTFLGPTFQHPLALGADMVLYSATKYLSGFSDMVAGVAIAERSGADPEDPQPPRHVRQHPAARRVLDARQPPAHRRAAHEPAEQERAADRRSAARPSANLSACIYPTLFDDPEQIRIFKAQCDYPGGMFSLDFHGGRDAAFEFLRNLRIARNAVSLGGVETLACHPKTTTHSGMPTQELAEAGIGDGLVRISVGIEDWRDLLADFEQALDTIG